MVDMVMMVKDDDDGEHWGSQEKVRGEPAVCPTLTLISSGLYKPMTRLVGEMRTTNNASDNTIVHETHQG